MSNKFSVISIVSGRQSHLNNLIEGIKQSSVLPDELIIVGINETPKLSVENELNLKIYKLDDPGEHFSAARARNFGASKASNNHLVFLDVDCIPSVQFFEQILIQGIANNTLIMGNPRYLLKSLEPNFPVDSLFENSIHHPHRPKINGSMIADDYMLFWSLAFYIPKHLFQKLEGFDEKYCGYGAEDTDLSLKLKYTPGYKLLLSEATVFHQQHPVYSPPVHQLDSIINNAEIFYKKWNYWVMDNWLEDFQKMGLISWNSNGKYIQKIKEPSEVMKAECFKPEAPFM